MNPSLIIITGAASGIGKELSLYFQMVEVPLILIDKSEELLNEFFGLDAGILLLAGDVSNEDTWHTCIRIAQKKETPISHLINCAGVIQPGFLLDFELSTIDFHLDVNAKGSILGTSMIGREMRKQGFGHIINLSSLAGLAAVPGLSLYSASKFAIRGFSLAAYQELKEFGVHVSVLCPDLVATPMLDLQLKYPEEAALSFSGSNKILQTDDIRAAILQLMKRPRPMLCIPRNRGWLAKLAGSWPEMTGIVKKRLHNKGKKMIKILLQG